MAPNVASRQIEGIVTMSLQNFSLIAVAATLAASSAMAASPTGNSSATALNFNLSINGANASLTNQVYATGSAPPNYSVQTPLAKFSKTKTFSNQLTLKATAANILDKATGKSASGGLTTTSSSSAGSFGATVSSAAGTALTITITPPKKTPTAPALLSTASFAITSAGKTTSKGTATFGTVTIAAPLFNINKTISGPQAANTYVYGKAGDAVTLVANRQTPIKSGGKTTGIVVDALALHVNNYVYGPYTISGDIAVGTDKATALIK
jgi:hypothetical protein